MCVLVLSPHRDDAAFSCGLLLMRLASEGMPIHIANVCTVSDYAPYADARLDSSKVDEITRLRSSEDEAFVDFIMKKAARRGAKVEVIDLHWKDAPLRLQMPTEDVLNGGDPSSIEIKQLAAEFGALSLASVVLVPLALGGHLDHRLVRMAAVATWRPDMLLFYEDLPYACRIPPSERVAAIEAALPWPCFSQHLMPLDTVPAPGNKREMALCYPSQIAEAVADEMEEYGAAMSYAESLLGTPDALQTLKTKLRLT